MSSDDPRTSRWPVEPATRRPFRAVDVLSGSIDRRPAVKPERTRKQISAQLEPAQVRLLGELHARLNATADKRIEKSDLVGLGIELLAEALANAEKELAPAPDGNAAFRSLDDVRSYLRTHVRGRDSKGES